MLAVCVMRVLNFALGVVPFAGKFGWDMNFTLGYNKNEITDLAGSQGESFGGIYFGSNLLD